MKNSNIIYQKIRLSLLILSFGCSKINAQEAISTLGGDGTGIGSFSYTYGLVVYTTTESIVDSASIIQGVQIPFETYVVESCATDFNIDGITNGEDFAIFLGNFGLTCTDCQTDLNDGGVTDGADFGIFLGNFGLVCN